MAFSNFRLTLPYNLRDMVPFNKSLFEYKRRESLEVSIGDLGCGGNNPIRLQSMTTTDTMDTIASVEQSIRMIEAGCELVRLTAPSMKEAENLSNIRAELKKRGYNTPLVADIHYTPKAAEIAARIVEKVRVNPGNYADKKKFNIIEYSDAEYESEMQRIRERFSPLVKICKEYGTAMRIGTNHGSLSDRILSRYGDTPNGMVESALEFLRIAEDLDYYNIVLSMKSSNPQVMVQAYRLLVNRLNEEGLKPYPLHLGVTEAGEGEDGRIKSALGIGTLLEDGIGDTVRVSLTEEPEFEIPVARKLVSRYVARTAHDPIQEVDTKLYSPIMYMRRKTQKVINIGGDAVPVVLANVIGQGEVFQEDLTKIGFHYDAKNDKYNFTDQACDYVYLGAEELSFELPDAVGVVRDHEFWLEHKEYKNNYPLLNAEMFGQGKELHPELNFLELNNHELTQSLLNELKTRNNIVLVLNTYNVHGMADQRGAFFKLINHGVDTPVIIRRKYEMVDADDLQLEASTDLGGLLVDGFGDGVCIVSKGGGDMGVVNSAAFGILQASRTRISKTEYISCPSCGRTLFDLQETTAKIRKVTSHLKGLKIGIMGCIVNGPGEMADADYGYVGVGPGKISLYKGQEVVKPRIPTEHAVEELIDLIKEHGDWVDAEA